MLSIIPANFFKPMMAALGLTLLAAPALAGGVVIDGRTSQSSQDADDNGDRGSWSGSDLDNDGDDRQAKGSDRDRTERAREQMVYLWAASMFNGHYIHDDDGNGPPVPVPFYAAKVAEAIDGDIEANGCAAAGRGLDVSLLALVLLGARGWLRRRQAK